MCVDMMIIVLFLNSLLTGFKTGIWKREIREGNKKRDENKNLLSTYYGLRTM